MSKKAKKEELEKQERKTQPFPGFPLGSVSVKLKMGPATPKLSPSRTTCPSCTLS
jgi:hypothetical protein